jgi:hypothetical protein
MEIFLIILSAANALILWLCLKKLDIISRDTSAREELSDTIEKFAALALDHKKKVVSFKAKVVPRDE